MIDRIRKLLDQLVGQLRDAHGVRISFTLAAEGVERQLTDLRTESTSCAARSRNCRSGSTATSRSSRTRAPTPGPSGATTRPRSTPTASSATSVAVSGPRAARRATSWTRMRGARGQPWWYLCSRSKQHPDMVGQARFGIAGTGKARFGRTGLG